MRRRRAVTPTKLLIVTLGVTALGACSSKEKEKETPVAVSAPVAAPAASADFTQLVGLASELQLRAPEEVRAAREHYRPLCDAQGYPLVGNVAAKSFDSKPHLTASAFCAEVRAQKKS